MPIAIIGSGPAGLTAAHRLQQAGHRATVFEAQNVIGGRTHAQHFGPGHHCDTGAGWLASFYTRTLALLDELNCRDLLLPRNVRGASNLLFTSQNGQVLPQPFSPESITESTLLTDEDKRRWRDYIAHLMRQQPDALEPDLSCDDRDAEAEFAPLGENLVNLVLRPLLEGPFFTRLSTLSAAMARAWLRALQGCTLYQVRGGMDAPWLMLARTLDVRLSEPVARVRKLSAGVEVVTARAAYTFDGVVLALPAPAITQMLAQDDQPAWLSQIKYAAHVRLYAAQPNPADADFGVHLIPPGRLFSIEHFSGKRGAWGACPPYWQWALACAFGPASFDLLDMPDDEVMRALWQDCQAVAPGLFNLDQASVTHLMRWRWAVPIMAPGHYRLLTNYTRQPPIVFAGDWTQQACVEGAVRSGEAAAQAFG
jgi:oxygen-dependent protoporphyrinogen oxidase